MICKRFSYNWELLFAVKIIKYLSFHTLHDLMPCVRGQLGYLGGKETDDIENSHIPPKSLVYNEFPLNLCLQSV